MSIVDPEVLLLLASGVAGGFVAGLLGVGGGVVYVAIFTSYLKGKLPVELWGDALVKYTIANAVFSLTFAGLTASLSHMVRRTFYLAPVLLLGIGGCIGAVGTTMLLSSVNYSSKAFAVVFSILLLPIIARMIFSKDSLLPESESRNALFPTGVVAGVVMAVSGLGGGVVMVPVLASLFKMPIKKAISISLGALALTGLGLSVFNIFISHLPETGIGVNLGPVILPMVLPVVVGVLVGSPLGVAASRKLHSRVLRILFVAACLAVMTKLFIEFVI